MSAARHAPGLDACPHCGGTSGILTNIRFKALRSYRWDGRDVDTDNYVVESETRPRCLDCGKSVRAAIAKPTGSAA
ncbi:hypothetical protein D3C87_1448180 [compost metagenome]